MHLFYSLVLMVARICRGWWQLLAETVQPRRRQAAQGLVEYALILVLIAVVVIGSITTVGRRVSSVYQEVNCGLAGAQGAACTATTPPPCSTAGSSSTCPPGHN